ncbi:MAG: hypothetical protein AAFR47_14475 [Pseudomonadota bacterium]
MTRMMTALAALALAGPAFAAVEDLNGDGMFSFEEVLATYPTITQETFVALDADGDGMLTGEEVAAAEADGLLPGDG